MTNPSPLEKQLLHMELSKGVNERERPETCAPATSITRLENVVQDQMGAWVKRPGSVALGSYAPTSPHRLFRTKDSLALIDAQAKLYQYSEGHGRFVRISTAVLGNSVPELSVRGADFIASSGNNAAYDIVAAASSSEFHAVCSTSGTSSAGYNVPVLTVYDRESGAAVATYQVATITNVGAFGVGRVRMVFVADRYLVVFCNNRVVSIDLGGSSPPTETALSAQSAAYVASYDPIFDSGPVDVAASATRAFVSTNGPLGVRQIVAVAGSTNVVAESVVTVDVALIAFSGSDLWYVDGLNFGSKSAANLAVQVQPELAHGAGVQPVGFYVTRTGIPVLVTSSTPAFGSTTATRLQVWYGEPNDTTTNVTLTCTFDGWNVVSHPFEADDDAQVYVHLCKALTTELAPHVVANITYPGTAANNLQSYNIIPPSASLEPYNGLTVNYTNAPATGISPYRAFTTDADLRRVSPVVPVRTTARGCGFAFFDVRGNDHAKKDCVIFGGNSYISGGAHSMYDGRSAAESGFVDMPMLNCVQSGTAGTIAAGAYKYLAVYRTTDARSSGSFSRVSAISSVTLSGTKKCDVNVLPCSVTRRFDQSSVGVNSAPQVIVDLYRTLVGGTHYYLVASSQEGTVTGLSTQALLLQSTGRFTVADNMSDATLATQPELFRQPGTPNTAVDRYCPPCSNLLTQHKDRLFTSDPYGDRIYYSSFFVDGECAWFNPAMSFMVHGGSGPITAIVSMDGRLFIFKWDGVFVVDGDGPGEAGPTGNEFSPPMRLATEYGCIDHRSVVVTNDGIAYRSHRGIELLTRSLQVKWSGDMVQNTCNAYPGTVAAFLDPDGRAHFLLSSEDSDSNVTGQTGAELVWDTTNDAWSIHYRTTSAGVYGRSMQDACVADLVSLGNVPVYADPASGAVYASDSTCNDLGYYTPVVLETGWLKTGQQARQRFSEILFLAKKRANHSLSISVAYDYVDSYTQTHVWEPDEINSLTIEELALPITTPESLAVRFLIQELPPTDTVTYPIGTGAGCDLLGVTIEVAQKTGTPKACRAGASYIVPFVAGVCPDNGASAGGDTVDVFGKGFTGATVVTFNGVQGTSVTVVSDSKLTVVTPAGVDGYADVEVFTPGGSHVGEDVYTYGPVIVVPPWAPTDASVPVLAWYKADAGVTGSAPVTAIADQSGVGDANRNQSASLGTLNGSQYGGAQTISDLRATSGGAWSTTPAAPITILVIGELDSVKSFISNGVDENMLWYNGTEAKFYSLAGALSSGVAVNVPSAVMFSDDGTGAGDAAKLFVGSITVPAASGATMFSACNKLDIGIGVAGVGSMVGKVAEIIVWDGDLSAADKTNLITYLNDTRAYGLGVT